MTDKVISAGSLLIESMLPESVKPYYDPSELLNKNGVNKLVSNLVKHGGSEAHESLQKLSNLFFETATRHGYTTPLTDYENDSEERHAILSELQTHVDRILNDKSLTENAKNAKLGDLASEYGARMQKFNLQYMVGKGSTAGKMAQTGARGNPMQLAQGTASPVMGVDIHGNPVPVVIKKSFAEGLSPAEHIAMSYGGRASTIKTQLSTSLPGALFKSIVPNVMHEVITIPDCHTTNGIMVPVTDSHALLHRVEAGSNHVIDEVYYKELKGSGKKQIKVRSALTCEAPKGVCQKCYGIDSYGHFPDIGQNVGVIASQSISEVLTQAMLSTKHKGGAAGRQRNEYEQASNLLNMPENFQDEATIAKLNGKITKIEQTALKDHNVYVNDAAHFVPNVQELKVKIGDAVRAGDALSTGTINPKQLVDLKGLGAGRSYLSNALREVYGGGLDPRHFDVVSKNMMKYVKVTEPGNTGLAPHDVVTIESIEPFLKQDSYEVHLPQARGKVLSHRILDLLPGTVLDQNHIDYLHSHGVEDVQVSRSGITVEPVVKGITSSKLLDKNWISRLSFKKLKDSIQEAAALGQESEIHTTDPVTAYVMGSEFGEGPQGSY